MNARICHPIDGQSASMRLPSEAMATPPREMPRAQPPPQHKKDHR
jgi:hypothetical protein